MPQVLSRKYRPKVFEEIIGQRHITQALQNAIQNKSVGHAYLLAGTRGIGKTSTARIFAKALTCQKPRESGDPCLTCSHCLSVDKETSFDVQEIDGAGHNGVENMRALMESAQYLPSRGHYKVYIIDEVHMLSTSSFNALLKTLEEPPAHVVFILATTIPEKLPETVLSRCQRFDFRNAKIDILAEHIEKILKREEITIKGNSVLHQICRQGKGSFRDTLSLLEQILSYSPDKSIDEDSVTMSLGLARGSSLKLLTNSILKGRIEKLETVYRQCLQENVDLGALSQGLLDSFYFIIGQRENAQKLYDLEVLERDSLEDISLNELFWIFETLAKDLDWAVTSFDPEKIIEVILKKVALRREFFKESKSFGPAPTKTEPQMEKESPKGQEVATETPLKKRDDIHTESKDEAPPASRDWEKFMRDTFSKYPALGANLEQGNILKGPEIQDDTLYLDIGFDPSGEVFLDYLKDPKVFGRFKKIVQEYFGISKSHIKLSPISLKKKKQINFRSRVEIAEDEFVQEKKEQKEKLLENEYLKEAQTLFNSQVDRVILNQH
ncbi:MAG: DNA polymerase III subunit gamma/tau [Bacteriovoracales bacterium]|nr:DNA polymerase III subunit gamma/tau [Bacteriovoracales bacterium]